MNLPKTAVLEPIPDTGTAGSRELVSQLKKQWDDGRPADARAFLDEHPDLASNKDLVADLAYEEYCQRRKSGVGPDPTEFAVRFPECKTTLRRILALEEDLQAYPQLLPLGDPSPWPNPGESFQGFKVIRELGRGAFARVYLARQRELGDRLVAVKVSRLETSEANILGQIPHDNIVAVHSVQKDPATGWTLVCMPYFGPATLCDVLDHAFSTGAAPPEGSVVLDAVQPRPGEEPTVALRPPSPALAQGRYVDAVVDIGAQLADALAFVHARKIYHRDLKPSNVLMGPDGRPRLLDFNLSFDAKSDQQLMGGTLPYMAPEQLRATDHDYLGPTEQLDGRTDIFSLGVILFELLTGEHPFGPIPLKAKHAEQRKSLLQKQKHGPADIQKLNPQVEQRLTEVINRCLAWNAADRFATAEELAEALRACLPPSALQRPRSFWKPWLVAAALLFAVTGSYGAYYSFREPPSAESRDAVAVDEFRAGRFEEAADNWTQALLQQESAERWFWRGRAYMKMGRWDWAINDLQQADKARSEGKTYAGLAHCNMQLKPRNLALAIQLYEQAIAKGFRKAVVLNNLGDACIRLGGKGNLERASQVLHEAVQLDPNLLSPYCNLAKLDLFCVNTTDFVPHKGRAAVEQALKICPSGHLYWDAARLYAVTGARDLPLELRPGWRQQALAYVKKAVEFGVTPKQLREDGLLACLKEEPGWEPALQPPARVQLAAAPQFALDPLADLAP